MLKVLALLLVLALSVLAPPLVHLAGVSTGASAGTSVPPVQEPGSTSAFCAGAPGIRQEIRKNLQSVSTTSLRDKEPVDLEGNATDPQENPLNFNFYYYFLIQINMKYLHCTLCFLYTVHFFL